MRVLLNHVDAMQDLGSSIAMHIVATRPLSLDKKSVPAEALEGLLLVATIAASPAYLQKSQQRCLALAH